MVQVISYDLSQPRRDYSTLFEAIKSIANGSWHCVESVWLIQTDRGSGAVRDYLRQHMHENDKLVVIRAGVDWATSGINSECNNWLRDNVK